VQVGIHPRLEDWDATQLVEFRGVRFIVEGAGAENIEMGVNGGDKMCQRAAR
jgi:hypothetical protein